MNLIRRRNGGAFRRFAATDKSRALMCHNDGVLRVCAVGTWIGFWSLRNFTKTKTNILFLL